MEVYTVPEQGLADTHMIPSAESNPQFTSSFEQFKAMYNEGAPEFVVHDGLCYPTATNYGYICTGFETPNWDDHHRIFGMDGQEIRYTSTPNESLPYVYSTQNYGYSQSPFNPYNPYIPGAMIGSDGQFLGAQQYYAVPSYDTSVSSPVYLPMVLQSTADNGLAEARVNSQALKHNVSSKSPHITQKHLRNHPKPANSFTRVSEGTEGIAGSSKQPVSHGNVGSVSVSSSATQQILQVRAPQTPEINSNGKASSAISQPKPVLPSGHTCSDLKSRDGMQTSGDEAEPKLPHGSDMKVNPDTISEGNPGPRTNKPQNHLVVKALTRSAGDPDGERNIIIHTDQFNRPDFQTDYAYAKFFVIKSYSEDDVHKSIKYSVWSSTPNGNKKLHVAYEDAKRLAAGDPRGCPIFLFFSVNASGQFCGVAEMKGPVDFHKDMDFWQQDKWSGSFPVKWHIVKDVPNPHLRHIVLENNENKPVTFSRDTQEIRLRKGLEMLKIFKNYNLKTSILDDFIYYENRQRIMQEEKARMLLRSYENPYLVPSSNPPRKFQSSHIIPSTGGERVSNQTVTTHESRDATTNTAQNKPEQNAADVSKSIAVNGDKCEALADGEVNVVEELKIGSLSISSKDQQTENQSSATETEGPTNVVTIGSMTVKVAGVSESSSGVLTVGSILLDPSALGVHDESSKNRSGRG